MHTRYIIICPVCLAEKKAPQTLRSQLRPYHKHGADLNMPGTSSPSLVWAWHSPCTWLAGGPHQTCPPEWAESILVGQRGWSAVGSRTGRERAPSWPRPHPDTPWPRHQTAGSWTMGWSDLCLHCSKTGLQRKNMGIRINTHKQNYKRHKSNQWNQHQCWYSWS